MGNTDRAWEAFGQQAPYYGVFSKPRYLPKTLEGAAHEEFFRTGEMHIDHVFSVIRETLDPEFAPRRALDFGCGVARVTIPLARRAGEVVGLDVSPSMLAEARKNCDLVGLQNVEFHTSDDRLSALTGEFDFVHSHVVFQHIPRKRGEAILGALLDRLSDGGVGALHFTYGSRAPRWRRWLHGARANVPLLNELTNLAQGRPLRFPHMRMVDYDLGRLIWVLQETGCHRVQLRFTDHGEHLGVVLFFKRAPTAPF
jgi:SAM-dependent methyltransferase